MKKLFIVVAKSLNTNSFGLYQMIVMSKDGEVYKTHASMYNAKEEGETIAQTLEFNKEGEIVRKYFVGHEMSTKMEDAPQEIVEEMFN